MSQTGSSSLSEAPRRHGKRDLIATRACESCRRRKVRCDEKRPTCSNCRGRAIQCYYPSTTSKQIADATNTIVESISRLEGKFDHHVRTHASFGISGAIDSAPTHSGIRSPVLPTRRSTGSLIAFGLSEAGDADYTSASTARSGSDFSHHASQHSPLRDAHSARPLTVPHSILLWPSVRDYLSSCAACSPSDISGMHADGTAWFIKREMCSPLSVLPAHIRLNPLMSAPSPLVPGTSGVSFEELELHDMLQFTEAYFNTFNVLLPILSRPLFSRDVLQHVVNYGFVDGDKRSVMALLVFALGAVAIHGTSTSPVSTTNGKPSGIRGGSVQQPPGLAVFNEARRRMGDLSATDMLEKVQLLLLQGIYFECCARYIEFWHSLTAASMACQLLIRCNASEWDSTQGDMIKRAYWTCVVSEEFFHVDMDLPKTGISALQDNVPMPHFHEVREQSSAAQVPFEQRLEFNVAYFLALITLRRIITRTHALLQDSDEHSVHYGGARIHLLGEMALQLDSWREALPVSLKWSDDEDEAWDDVPSLSAASSGKNPYRDESPFWPHPHRGSHHEEFRHGDDAHGQVETYSFPMQQGVRSADDFSTGVNPTGDGFNLDMVKAALRTRFLYARFMICLPGVYKTLHAPQHLTKEDAESCVTAVHCACNWPLAMAPTRNKKRLVPNLLAWTQNFLGALLILYMAMEDPRMRAVCEGRIPIERLKRAATPLLDWIYDMRQVDTTAEWAWPILERLYFNSSP